MKNIVSLLEKIGSSADHKSLTNDELKTMFQQHALQVNAEQDLVAAVEMQLSVRTNVVCGIFPAEEPGKEQPEDEPEEDKNQPASRLVVNA